jgi:hypothetical protein
MKYLSRRVADDGVGRPAIEASGTAAIVYASNYRASLSRHARQTPRTLCRRLVALSRGRSAGPTTENTRGEKLRTFVETSAARVPICLQANIWRRRNESESAN